MSSVSLSSETPEIAVLELLNFSKNSKSTENQTPPEKLPMSQAEWENITSKMPTSSAEIFTIEQSWEVQQGQPWAGRAEVDRCSIIMWLNWVFISDFVFYGLIYKGSIDRYFSSQ